MSLYPATFTNRWPEGCSDVGFRRPVSRMIDSREKLSDPHVVFGPDGCGPFVIAWITSSYGRAVVLRVRGHRAWGGYRRNGYHPATLRLVLVKPDGSGLLFGECAPGRKWRPELDKMHDAMKHLAKHGDLTAWEAQA